MNTETQPTSSPTTLGAYLRSVRMGLNMTLRDVEAASEQEVSNAYLSQLENGKIGKPAPHVLYALAQTYAVSYESLMELAGYLSKNRVDRDVATQQHGSAATFALSNLTPDEEAELLKHLEYLRWKRKRPG
ncbi:helix-turn-helix domain-containing protein [Xanthomonas translucens pv. poae]|uniref:helix-turn-helix domain-containing protein n=1 Tax=Xanthomonas graminis TaxID=3390026 RepID=UPI0009BB0AC9|nr:helix-turn-helix transcriptional regulator [Xanthomonas translucens]UKE61750.1 helix-turn-helix domain-containing protein [Xanthomonas translucens pv. poae]